MQNNQSWQPPDVNPDGFKDINTFLNETDTSNTLSVHCITLLSSGIATLSGVLLLLLLFRRVIRLDHDFRIMFTNLTIADLLTAIGLLCSAIQNFITYPVPVSSDLCVIQSFVCTMSVMASFFWTIVIGIVCFRDVWHQDHAPESKIRVMPFVVVHFLCWGIPCGIMIAAWQFGALGGSLPLGNTAGWCWIRSCDDDCTSSERVKLFLWMLVTGKLWEFLSYLSIVNIFILGYFLHFRQSNSLFQNVAASIPHAKTEVASHQGFFDNVGCQGASSSTHAFYNSIVTPSGSSRSSNEDENVPKLLFWIPVALIFARIWGTVRFIFDAMLLLQPSMEFSELLSFDDVFVYFQAIGDTSQTTCNLILTIIVSKNARNFLFCRPWKSKNYEEI